MSIHSKLSASGSKKWLNCPLSLTLESKFKDEESVYAREGTLAHSIGELKIKLELELIKRSEYVKRREELLKDTVVEDISELDMYTNNYRDFVIERYNSYLSNSLGLDLLIEEKLDYSKYAVGGFGTGDIVLCDYETVEVIDLKYGKGVKVDAYENSQLMLYGLGALERYSFFDIDTVKLTVYQPRIDNISTYEIKAEDLIKWGEEVVKPKSELALSGQGKCIVGSHCDEGFCKARPLCVEYNARHTKVENYGKKHPSLLTEDELVDIYEIATTYDKWVGTVKTYLLQEMLKGSKFKGLKLVEGKSYRSFTNETEVIKVLEAQGLNKKEYLTEKLISVASAEKLLGKSTFNDVLGDLTVKPKGSPTIAFIEDERAEFNSAELDFMGFGD